MQRGEQVRTMKKRSSMGSSCERRLSSVVGQGDPTGMKAYAMKTLARARASHKGF